MDTPRRLLLTALVAVVAVTGAIVAVVLADPVKPSVADPGRPQGSGGEPAAVPTDPPTMPVWGFARFDGVDLPMGETTNVPVSLQAGSWQSVPATVGHTATVTHVDAGRYQVVFPDIAVPDGLGVAVATAVAVPGTPTVAGCHVVGWGQRDADQQVDVACHTVGGVVVDAGFSVMFTFAPVDYRPRVPTPYAYVRADARSGDARPGDTSYSVTGQGTVQVRREGPGHYAVDLIGPTYARPGNTVQVNAVGDTEVGCDAYEREVLADRQTVHVGCAVGEQWTDAQFVLVYGSQHSLLPEDLLAFGYVFTGVSRDGSPPMRPEIGQTVNAWPEFSANSAGKTNTVRRLGVGRYEVTFPGVGRAPDNVQLTPFGDPTVRCVLDRWVPPATDQPAGSVTVSFGCVGASGDPVDAFASVAYVSALSASNPTLSPSSTVTPGSTLSPSSTGTPGPPAPVPTAGVPTAGVPSSPAASGGPAVSPTRVGSLRVPG